jgi:hypothetical protein
LSSQQHLPVVQMFFNFVPLIFYGNEPGHYLHHGSQWIGKNDHW